jgi:hypothetical protein
VNDEKRFPAAIIEWADRPLDVARSAFEWLVTGPDPVAVDGRAFPGLPDRAVPLDELRAALLRRGCSAELRDAVWAHLVGHSRAEGGTWTVAAVGVAPPALTGVAAWLSARFADDPSDIHAAVLAGFVAELAVIDLGRPRILLRLRWAAYRAGMVCVRDALDAPVPTGNDFTSAAPPAPAGHPDFVLARAVADGAITAHEAELIAVTRLEMVPLVEAGAERGMSYQAAKKAPLRAEGRLVAYLDAQASDGTNVANVAADALANLAVTTGRSPAVTSTASRDGGRSGRVVSLRARKSRGSALSRSGCGRSGGSRWRRPQFTRPISTASSDWYPSATTTSAPTEGPCPRRFRLLTIQRAACEDVSAAPVTDGRCWSK